MNITHNGIDELAGELLTILDADAAHLKTTLDHLNNLRVGVIKRDEASLELLLESIKEQQNDKDTIESRRQKFRQNGAALLGCRSEQVNISRIMEYLPEELRLKVSGRKAALEKLVETLKNEYMATAMLLNECSRFNRLLLESIFGSRGGSVATYNASGQMQRSGGSGFITMQF